MDKAMALVMSLPDFVKESVVDFSTGMLPHNGKRVDVVAVIVDRLTTEQVTEIKRMKKCVKVSSGHYQYAPEIEKTVLYFKY